MPGPPTPLISKPVQIGIISLVAAGLAIGGFEAGRETVDAAAGARSEATVIAQPSADPISQKTTLLERDHSQITIRDIATVPFSELYDVLKSASREQLLAWARDLERMPRGPRQRAAVAAYYKSLVQVDHHAALEAVLHAKNLDMRDVALEAMSRAAPESIWGDLAEMLELLPHQRRRGFREDVIWNWSRVDPAATSRFIEKHPVAGEDERLFSLLCNWTEIDPTSARDWLEESASRQTKDAFRAFLTTWAGADRPAAINYAVANATRANFAEALNDLAYYFVRQFRDDATTLLLLLPREQAREAMKAISHNTTAIFIHAPEDYQKPPDVIAPWMVRQALDLWDDSIGNVVNSWLIQEAGAATAWLNQLPTERRDAVIADLCQTPSDFKERVFTLGLTIHDRKVRDVALGNFARGLGQTQEEAIEAISQLEIPEEQKSYLRRIMPEVPVER
jgi:hypothetical protein